MDVTDLKYEGESFDLIVDKCTLDAVLCSDLSYLNVAAFLKVGFILNDFEGNLKNTCNRWGLCYDFLWISRFSP